MTQMTLSQIQLAPGQNFEKGGKIPTLHLHHTTNEVRALREGSTCIASAVKMQRKPYKSTEIANENSVGAG